MMKKLKKNLDILIFMIIMIIAEIEIKWKKIRKGFRL